MTVPALVLGAALLAQVVPQSAGPPPADDKRFVIRPAIGSVLLGFELSDDDDDGRALEFEPNAPLVIGLKGGYRRFQLSGSIGVAATEEVATHGKTSFLDFQIAQAVKVARRELVVGLFFQSYRGFHLANTAALEPGATTPLLYPAMRMRNFGGTLTYFLDPEFSYDAAFLEFHPRSGGSGSFALRFTAGNMSMSSGGVSLVPASQQPRFARVAELTALDATYGGLGGGYAHDWRFWSGWLCALSVTVTLDVALQAVTIANVVRRGPSLSPGAAVAFAFAYAGPTVHAGINAFADIESTRVEGHTAETSRVTGMLFAGVRF